MANFDPDDVNGQPGTIVPTAKARHGTSLLYPPQGYDLTKPPEAFQAPAGVITQVQIDLGASASYVQQPHCVKTIDDVTLVPDFSCYVVAGSDGLPVDPKEWRVYGGKIRVKINRDTTTATVSIYPADLPHLAPFTIGWDDGENTFGGLFLLGDGVGIWKRGITVETGLSADLVAEDTTPLLDNPFLQTRAQAWDAAHEAIARKLGDWQTLVLTVSGVRGVPGVDDLAPETALGRIAGARVLWDGLFYRIRSAQHSPAGIQLTCVQDVTGADLDAHLPAGLTMAQFDALHAGETARQIDTHPFEGGDLG